MNRPIGLKGNKGDHEEFAAFLNRDFVLLRPPRAAFDGFTAVAMGGDDSAEDEGAAHLKTMFCQSHRFLMTYDWAGAFAGDRDFDDRGSEFRLPAPNCCFDFYVSGGHVLALISEQAISADGSLAPFDGTDRFLLGVKLKSHNWILRGESGAGRRSPVVCIHLEKHQGRVRGARGRDCRTEVVRAPHKLNAARDAVASCQFPIITSSI